jgi:hypothetical protein
VTHVAAYDLIGLLISHVVHGGPDEIDLLISMTAAGTKDFGGIVQPAYLNFNVTLNSNPSGELQVGPSPAPKRATIL